METNICWTVTCAVAEAAPAAAVMVADPFPTVVTTPLPDTDATWESDDVQVSVALIWAPF
jgi:hypothetical protein